MPENSEIAKRLDMLIKLSRMQLMPKISELKKELLVTDSQRKAYEALDGTRTIAQIARSAGYRDESTLRVLLPEWERRGLILGVGKGPAKKYVNMENLEA